MTISLFGEFLELNDFHPDKESKKCISLQHDVFDKFFGILVRPGKTVEDEAMADHVAYVLSWKAFEFVMDFTGHLTLPDVHGLNVKQLFTISTAYTNCFMDTAAYLDRTNVHPDWYIRTNRGFSNMPYFADLWSCGSSQPMIAKPVCSLET